MLPITVDLGRVSILLAGNGVAALRRLGLLREAGASDLTVFAPDPITSLAEAAGSSLQRRLPDSEEIRRAGLIFAVDLPEAALDEIRRMATTAGTLLNVEDDRPRCNFHSPALVRRGDLLVAISTMGKSPGLAGLFRRLIESRLDKSWGDRLDEIATLRQSWRAAGDDHATIAKRTEEWAAQRGWLDQLRGMPGPS